MTLRAARRPALLPACSLLAGAALGGSRLADPIGWPPCVAAGLLTVIAFYAARRMATVCLLVTLSLVGAELASSEMLRFEGAQADLFPDGAAAWEGHFVGRLLEPVEREPDGDQLLRGLKVRLIDTLQR